MKVAVAEVPEAEMRFDGTGYTYEPAEPERESPSNLFGYRASPRIRARRSVGVVRAASTDYLTRSA